MSKAVLFDIDGTLVDSVDLHAHAWQDALRHFGYPLPFTQVRHQIGKGADQLLPALLPPAAVERHGEAIAQYRNALYQRVYLPQVRAFPAVRALLCRLRADGQRLLLASSAQGEELATYKRVAQIADLLEGEVSADDVTQSKPHPDVFHAALKCLGSIAPAEVVVVGDTPYDAEAAGQAGLRTIGVLCGGFPADELRAAGCIALYRDPADLLQHYAHSPWWGSPLRLGGRGVCEKRRNDPRAPEGLVMRSPPGGPLFASWRGPRHTGCSSEAMMESTRCDTSVGPTGG